MRRRDLQAELVLAERYADGWRRLYEAERAAHQTDLDLLTTALALLPLEERRQLSAMVRTLDTIAGLPEANQ